MTPILGGSAAIPPPGSVLDTALASSPSIWTPGDSGLKVATGDPANAANTAIMIVGSLYQIRFRIPYAMSVSHIWIGISNGGAVLGSGARVSVASLFDANGTELAVSADQSAAWTATGAIDIPISAQALAAGQIVYVGLVVGSATTAPTLARLSTTGAHANMNLAGATLRWGRNGTGLASMPASITPANAVQTAALTYWAGLS